MKKVYALNFAEIEEGGEKVYFHFLFSFPNSFQLIK